MKPRFHITQKSGVRFVAAFVVAALAGSTLAACSNSQPSAPEENVAPPMPAENAAPAATNQPTEKPADKTADKASTPKTYRDIGGKVVSINQPAKNVAGAKTTVTLDHEDIPNFMRAMQMTVPLQKAADAAKLKKGDKIRCDFVLENGSLVLSNIRVLPADTKLKLAPA